MHVNEKRRIFALPYENYVHLMGLFCIFDSILCTKKERHLNFKMHISEKCISFAYIYENCQLNVVILYFFMHFCVK